MKLRELITQCPELGELLSEIENRISFLENSLPYSIKEEEPSDKEVQVTQDLRPLKGELNHILNKINTHIDASKKKDAYTIK